MGGEELLHGSSVTAAALAAGEGWERGLGKGIRLHWAIPSDFRCLGMAADSPSSHSLGSESVEWCRGG